MNHTMGENGLVPSRLVFEIIPGFRILNTDLPNKHERMAIISKVQAEMNTIIAEKRVRSALNRNIPLAVDRVYKMREEVLVYDDEDKQCKGPYIFCWLYWRTGY